jgi:hypothetical protein
MNRSTPRRPYRFLISVGNSWWLSLNWPALARGYFVMPRQGLAHPECGWLAFAFTPPIQESRVDTVTLSDSYA